MEIWDPDEWPRAKVAQLQERLRARGYHPGAADGRIGTGTAAALAAFQHDQGLTVSGVPTGETDAALYKDSEPRPIPADRAAGKPADSLVLSSTQKGIGAAAIAGGAQAAGDMHQTGDTAGAIDQALGKAEQYHSYYDRAMALLGDSASAVAHYLATHPLHIVALGAIGYFGWHAYQARRAHIDDYRTMRTP